MGGDLSVDNEDSTHTELKKKVVKKKWKKKRRRGLELIDITLPLWQNLFSVIFKFLSDGDLNKLLTVSKQMLEIVRNYGVFSRKMRLSCDNESRLIWVWRLDEFNFSSCALDAGFDFIDEELVILMRRQVYLRELTIDSFAGGDLSLFCAKNERGNLFFPNLKKITLRTVSLEEYNFWDFLREFKKRFSFYHQPPNKLDRGDSRPWKKGTVERLVKNGKFEEFYFSHQNVHGLPEEELSHLKNLDAETVVFEGERRGYFGQGYRFSDRIFEALQENLYISKIIDQRNVLHDKRRNKLTWKLKRVKVLEFSRVYHNPRRQLKMLKYDLIEQ